MLSTAPPEHHYHQLNEDLVSRQQHLSLVSLMLWTEVVGVLFLFCKSRAVKHSLFNSHYHLVGLC